MDLAFIGQECTDSNFKNAFVSHFRVLDDSLSHPDDTVINELIKNKTFDIENVPEFAKDREREGFSEFGYLKPYHLAPVFKYELVAIEQFKQMNRHELYDSLASYLIIKKWPDYEVQDLEVTVSWLKKDIEKCNADRFYVIAMDWFDKNDTIINQHERGIYGYFITIIWIDREDYFVNSCHLYAD